MTIAAMNGVGHEFLWPNATKWANASIFVGFSISIAAFIAFMMRMLDIQVRSSKMYPLCITLLYAHIAMAVCNLISVETFAFYAEILNFLSAAIIIAVALKCLYQGQRSALFFIIAFLIFMLTGMIHGLMDFGSLPANIFTANALQIGSISEMLLLAFALAYRFDLIRKEIIETKNKQIAADELLVQHLQESERRLEDRVAERTDELQKLNKKLEELSETDGLTGIANRRCFNNKLEAEWRRALRNGEPLTLAILDVDWFKKYNDHYGHPAGDECIRKVAQICEQIYCRPGDLAARYGGEEFAFITPATSIEGAFSIAQKVCRTVESLAMPHSQSKLNYLTVSIGVASILPSEASNPESLLLAADQALYRAKNMGRNQASL
jgi:diguanylate cyclase (GGDEF)-like protein